MAVHTVKRGLDLPISGAPVQKIEQARAPGHVALMADDYVGMRPTMYVEEGDAVKRGQLVFEDKKNEGVRYTAPGAGTLKAINRGERRALQSVVLELSDSERAGEPLEEEQQDFETFTGKDPAALTPDDIRALLLESGLWTAFRTRPFSKVPAPDSEAPHSIFVTAVDTHPLAPSVEVMMEDCEADLQRGLLCLAKVSGGLVYLCRGESSSIHGNPNTGVHTEDFVGPHPAGTPGLHIHRLDPVHREKTVWYIHCEDVVRIGRLFETGRLDVSTVISLAGPGVERPRLLRTRLGAATDDLVEGELKEGEHRVISGSVLSGRSAFGPIHGYLGRYHHQISVLREGREREFMGWIAPGKEKFSVLPIFLSKLLKRDAFEMTTSTHGGVRAIVPIGTYEKVTPFDMVMTYLLRSLAVGDVETCEKLGVLELDEEDVALATFVCPCKNDYGPMLREVLDTIEREG